MRDFSAITLLGRFDKQKLWYTLRMNYFSTLALIVVSIFLFIVINDILDFFDRKKLLKKLKNTPFDQNDREVLKKIPHYRNLNDTDKEKIERSILIFLHTKEFLGVRTLVTQEMKLVISFYACLLLLHIDTDNCYDDLKTVVIYPHATVTEEIKSYGGIYTKARFMIEGQSANNAVMICWHEAKSQAYHLRHNNVIIHEFTHEIDFMSGILDGAPPIERSKYHQWTHTLLKEFKKLNNVAMKNRNWGKYKTLGAYAATNESEFFAVVTERFFESPNNLKQNFPELYEELKSFYKIDTAELLKKRS